MDDMAVFWMIFFDVFAAVFIYCVFRKTCCHVAELRGCHSASHTCAAFGSDNRCKYTKRKQFWPAVTWNEGFMTIKNGNPLSETNIGPENEWLEY